MKPHYRPAFNARVYGPAEHRADIYWRKRLKRGGDSHMANERKEKFALEWVVNNNATQAAIRAGHSKRTTGESESLAKVLPRAEIEAGRGRPEDFPRKIEKFLTVSLRTQRN